MSQTIELASAGGVVLELIATINENRAYLSEIDGAIGDGDHGINMSKGFSQCRDGLLAQPALPGLAQAFDALAMTLLDGIGGSMGPLYGSVFMGFAETLAGHQRMDAQLFGAALAQAFDALAMTLLDGIGGSMGPLYGSLFMGFAEALAGQQRMDAQLFGAALTQAVDGVQSVGNAQVGDKTLMDTLIPARDAYLAALAQGQDFAGALGAMVAAAEAGWQSTKALQARIGRSARLGERSIGVLDAGATSCFLLLRTLGSALQSRLT